MDKINSTWVHPFERSGLGIAPFRCTGYAKLTYQACPEAPVQCGGSCHYCGTIMHTYYIQGTDGRAFKVGCDCVEKTGDTELTEGLRRAERAYEQKIRDDARKEWLASEEGQNWAAEMEGRTLGHAFRKAEYTYDREQEGLRSKHFGTVGERVVLTLTVVKKIPLESQWGLKVLHIMKNGDNRCVWFCTGETLAEGETVTVKATIKAHNDREGVKQTVLTRVKA